MEYGISELCENDIKVYNMVKEITKEGQYNYIKIEEEDPQGYVIKANKEIKKNTLICEYVGDVLTFQELCVKNIKNDSIMDLIWTPQSETSLVICPHKNSNIARFISGVNNSVNFKNQVNTFSTKVSINGVVHILLIAGKDRKENEILYYNYNSVANNYPTKNFVYKRK